jgi:hypothetical protein
MTQYTIYKKNVMEALIFLSDYAFQKIAWFDNNEGLSYSFNDNISDLFDDFKLEQALHDNVVVFGRPADQALRALNLAVENVGYDRDEVELIDAPDMQIVREKAAIALALVKASDGLESTIEIIE